MKTLKGVYTKYRKVSLKYNIYIEKFLVKNIKYIGFFRENIITIVGFYLEKITKYKGESYGLTKIIG